MSASSPDNAVDSTSTENIQVSKVKNTPDSLIIENSKSNSDNASVKECDVKIMMNDVSEPLAGMKSENSDHEKKGSIAGKRKIRFRRKEFKVRPSLLTTLYETDARVVYNFGLAFFFLVISAVLVRDFFNTGNPFDHVWLISWNFAQLPSTLCCWAVMFASTIAFPYYGLTLWARVPSERIGPLTNFALGMAYVGYILSLFYYSIKFVFYWQLSCACTFIIACENSRLAMKSHSFLRENFVRAVQRKKNLAMGEEKSHPPGEGVNSDWPTLEHFIYYMFCPAFLYRDSYPRAESRSWSLVARYALQCLTSIYILNVFFVLIVHPVFNSMDYEHGVEFGTLAFSMFQSILPGAICMFAIFYGLLHSWMNMFAEAMQFGDRAFYSNWWSSKNMAEYYRSWNLIVHEWLYVYIYRDITLVLGEKWGPKLSQFTVFFLSAAFHEYWFGLSLRVFYPVIFFMYFICGGAFFAISGNMQRPHIWNTILWFNLLFGTGVFFAAYAPEYYARQRCPKVIENDFVDLIVPRIWSCMKI